MRGLVGLLRAENPSVVAESIVVIRKMLQQDPEEHAQVINHLCKQLEKVEVPIARASIVWVVGEYCRYAAFRLGAHTS
jgi:AP-3 complex subunit beta